MAKQKFYVVWSGREPGIFTTWAECQAQVRGFAGARFKAYPSRAEAEKAFIESEDVKIYGGPSKDDVGATSGGGSSSSSSSSKVKPKVKSSRGKPAPHAAAFARGEWVLYTDGGADPNPGPGGFGVVVMRLDADRQELYGGYEKTTNNRMELMGWIKGLQATPVDAEVAVFSDSKYVGDMFAKGFAHGWRERSWRTSSKKPAANIDLWSALLKLTDERQVTFTFVRGHTGVPENERCDELATQAMAETLVPDVGYQDDSGLW